MALLTVVRVHSHIADAAPLRRSGSFLSNPHRPRSARFFEARSLLLAFPYTLFFILADGKPVCTVRVPVSVGEAS